MVTTSWGSTTWWWRTETPSWPATACGPGSTLTTGQALKNLVKFTGESVERVLPLLTANPARLVGLSYRKGSIAPGKDADLVVLDEELNVRETYVAGRLVYAGECE